MSQIIASQKYDLITLPRSGEGYVGPISAVATVINLAAIGTQSPNNANEASVPGLQNTFATIAVEVVDVGYIVGTSLGEVTGGIYQINVTGGGSGYLSAPAVSFTASTLVGSFTVSATGTGYSSPPAVTMSGGGGSGAAAVAVLTAGAVTGVTIAAMGAGYSSAPTVAFAGGGGSGAAATAVLAAPMATAYVSAGAVTSIAVTYPGAGYGSAPTVTLTGGSGSGATATALLSANAPSLTAVGCGAGNTGSAPGICLRLAAGASTFAFARQGKDLWLGIVGSTSGGTVRVFRRSY